MNEEYIKGFRKSPDSHMIERIHVRLEKKERIQRIKRYSFRSALAFAFVLGMLMIFSSQVRAEVLSLFMKIGGVQYHVTSEHPFNPYIPAVELEPEYLSWDEARSRFLSPLQLPAYVPDRYEREADTHLYVWGDDTPTLEVFWRKKGQFPMIGLFIAQCKEDAQGCGMAVGEGALEEITLNGKPATLVRGSWNEDIQQYERSVVISVIWRYDENSFYRLWSFDQSLEAELIKMAESIP
jgi:hypothetical protein